MNIIVCVHVCACVVCTGVCICEYAIRLTDLQPMGLAFKRLRLCLVTSPVILVNHKLHTSLDLCGETRC